MKSQYLLILIASFSIAAACSLEAQNIGDRPNIIVILCDDLGYGDLDIYGHPHIKTPRLHQMAKEGIRFTDFYSAAPVCSPSRVGLLTGRSPNRAGVYDWIPPAKEPKPNARDQVHMQVSEVTIPKLLQEAGYATAMAGKWHCNSKFNSNEQPQPGAAGFEHWMATQNNARPSHRNPKNFVRNGEAMGEIEGYSCQIVAEEGINWMRKQQEKQSEQPFFLYLAFHEPHEPVASPKGLVQNYLPVAQNEKEATYFANVENVDKAVGKVLDALKEMLIDENTLVIFTSDNGPETLNRYRGSSYSYGGAGVLRGMKLWTTEAGFRVAGIMRWPAGIAAGQLSAQSISALDFLPTFCQLAGKNPPEELQLDGTNFLPALKGKKIKRPKPLLWVYYNALNEHRVAMRHGQWKVLAKLDLERKYTNLYDQNIAAVKAAQFIDFEIYDLSKDAGETNNLLQSNPKKKRSLINKLKQQYLELLEHSFVWKGTEGRG